MFFHQDVSGSDLRKKIKAREIYFGGHKHLKIYGTLRCRSGKRMKRENRVFFASEKEALDAGYRPCGHCLKQNYLNWKNGPVQ
jgi:methylphosphotriester-DNA--protein-cysteine methyltransferase